MIDSHARNSRGMVDDKGSSVVLKFDDFNALIQYVRYFVETATSQRRLTIDDLTFEALVLNIKERKSAESDDVLILPVSTLLSISKQLWECRCAQLLHSLPRERPRSK